MTILPRETLRFGEDCREEFLHLDQDTGLPLRSIGLQMAGTSHLSKGYLVERHHTPYHVVLLTLGGFADLTLDGKMSQLTPPSMMILPAGSCYSYTVIDTWRVTWFHLANRLKWSKLSKKVIEDAIDLETLNSLSQTFISARSKSRKELTIFIANALAKALESLLVSLTLHQQDDIGELMVAIERAVESDLQRKWSEAELASLIHYSPQHLRRLAHKYWNCSPVRKITQMRIKKAKIFLEFSCLRLSCIARAVGYSDEYAFSAAFKRETNRSPSAWRRQQKTPWNESAS